MTVREIHTGGVQESSFASQRESCSGCRLDERFEGMKCVCVITCIHVSLYSQDRQLHLRSRSVVDRFSSLSCSCSLASEKKT